MALKFLNKKGWHTGSLRNIENVWKAEQKRDAEDKKLEELRKQIHEERERAEFRQLQEQAGLISSQERLEFLYDSGLAVGKGGSSFKALESLPKTEPEATASSSTPAKPEASALGALFEDKPQSANDAWRKLHSDPLLLIRQREQEALARIKNNPVKMSMIRKSVETKKNKDKDEMKHRKKHQKKKSKHRTHSSSETDSDHEDATPSAEKQRESRHKSSRSDKPSSKRAHTSDEESSEEDTRRKKYYDKECKDRRPGDATNPKYDKSDEHKSRKSDYDSQRKEYFSERPGESRSDKLSSKRAHASDEESSEEDTRRKKYYDKEYKDRRPSGAPNPKYDKSDDQHKTRKSDYESQRREYSSERPGESRSDKLSSKRALTSDEELGEEDTRRKKYYDKEYRDRRPSGAPNPKYDKSDDQHKTRKSDYESQRREYSSEQQDEPSHDKRRNSNTSGKPPRHDSNNRGRNPVKLSEEERAAKLREMQMDAEIHEEQRWKRLKKAADSEAQEAISDRASGGKNFLDATQKSIYGAEKGGSSTIEESVRRRAYYSQRGLASDGNAFRRS